MNQSGRAAGIVIVCDLQGTICKVIRDELHLTEAAEGLLGQFLVRLVDRRSVKKTLNFLLELKTRGACFDWEINLPVAGRVTTLHLGGVALDGQLLIIGSQTRNSVLSRGTCLI